MEGVADPTAIYAAARKEKGHPADVKEHATDLSASNVIVEEAIRPGTLVKPVEALLKD